MAALDGISRRSIFCLVCATIIMLSFFVVKTLLLFNVLDYSEITNWYEYLSVIFFMPPFFVVVNEFLQNKEKIKEDLGKKNIYLEHAAKIIRHDMHSGINTYLPRGIKSLNRRLSNDTIKELKIGSPLRLIEDGLHHAQKVYSGVYEFTNLVKEGATLGTKECNIKYILEDYLKLTAYKNQVILSDDLPTELLVNEALFCTAVDNFIRNGLKYNDSPTKWVKVYLKANYHTGSFIVVEDNGRGLTGEEFIELSKPYARKQGQKESGTGLGLNISIEILKEHGFGVFAKRKEDNGTKVYIKI